MGILYLIGAIILGAIGTLSIFGSSDPQAPWWLSWVSWFIFTPTFYLLFYTFDEFGVATAFALWGAGVSLITVIQGRRWGDKLSRGQFISIGLIFCGLILFGFGRA